MAKLYFRYGTVGSAKTMNLLAVRHNYERQGKKVLLCKPSMEDRFGKTSVTSRSGLTHEADVLLDDNHLIPRSMMTGDVACILVDEAQFLSHKVIDTLRDVVRHYDVPVICYGLRTDFRTELFPGSKRLLELADTIEEIKNTCQYCNSKAVFNLRFLSESKVALDGPVVLLGGDEMYSPCCYPCYAMSTKNIAIFKDPLGEDVVQPEKKKNELKEILTLVQKVDDAYDKVAWYSDAASCQDAYPSHIQVVELLKKIMTSLEGLVSNEE